MTGIKFPIDGNRSPFYQTPRLFNQNKTDEKAVAINMAEDTETFLKANEEKRNELLQQLDPPSRKALFNSLRQRYKTAKDKTCEDTIFMISVYEIKQMPDSKTTKGLVINILKFMNENVMFSHEVPGTKGRGACDWKGITALAEGNYNGCVEAARIFQELLNACDKNIQTRYVSSFNLNWAKEFEKNPSDILSSKDAKGHAIIEIKDGPSTFLVDTEPKRMIKEEETVQSMDGDNIGRKGKPVQFPHINLDIHVEKIGNKYYGTAYAYRKLFIENEKIPKENFVCDTIGEVNQNLRKLLYRKASFKDLEGENIIMRENDGEYLIGKDRFIIFEKRLQCPYNNADGLDGSSTITKIEALKYLKNPKGYRYFEE